MTYVGRGVDAISNVEKLDNITFDGSTTYNLTKSSVAFTPSGANNILISIDGVVQQGNFSVAGSTIIFDWSPTSSNTCNFIMHYGTGVLNVPADGVVSTAKVADDAITTDKLANSINAEITANTAKTSNATHSGEVTGATALTIADNIVDEANLKVSNTPTNGYALTAQSGNTGGLTWAASAGFDVSSITGATALAVEPASTDEMVISDAGTLKRLDMTHIYNLPACNVGGGSSIYPAHNSNTVVPWTVEGYDYGGCFNHTTGSVTLNGLTAPAHSFTPNVAGIYQFTTNIYFAGEGMDGDSYISVNHWINNGHYIDMCIGFMEHGHFDDNNLEANGTICIPMNGTGDYYQTKIWNTTGEAPELHFGYSSLTINRIAGLPVASRPNYG